MTRRLMDSDDGLRLAETQSRLADTAAWLSRDIAELNQLLDHLRARRRILLVGSAEQTRDVAGVLGPRHDVFLAETPETAFEIASLNPFDLVIAEAELPGVHDGLWLLAQLRAGDVEVRRVLIAREGHAGWAQHERDGLFHRVLFAPVHAVDLADLFGEETRA